MIKPAVAFAIACVALLPGCQSFGNRSAEAPSIKQMSINATPITYLDQGNGAPVVFVHGAFMDRRGWEAQRAAIAKRYRVIAMDQRYFGVAPWPDNGTQYSQATHVADLAAFINQLKLGPVHLVGRSYGANIALTMTVHHPELVRSLFLNEPPLPSILTNPEEQKVVSEERKDLEKVSAAAKAGNAAEATRLFFEWVNNDPGSFDRLPPGAKSMHLDNARTVPLHMSAPPPPRVTCEQLGQIKVPVTITKGEFTRPFYRVLTEAAHRCMPGSRLITISNARHGSPTENPKAFNENLLDFLARN